MCSLQQQVSQADPSAPSTADMQGGDPSQPDASSAPATKTTLQPTKFAKLLKFTLPLVQGAMVGGFGGNWHVPGSGYAAEENTLDRQRQFALQKQEVDLRKQMLQRQLYDDQYRNALEAARAREAESQGRRYDELIQQGQQPKHVIKDTSEGIMDVTEGGPESGQAHPILNMEPEKTGSLPMPGQEQMAPLEPYVKPAPIKPATGFTLGQGQERFDASGKKIATGAPKTFAPRTGRGTTPKVDQADIESGARLILEHNANDADKALADIQRREKSGTIRPEEAVALRARIREIARPGKAGTRKFSLSPDEMRKMVTAPPG
jgi:hypothetical protein